MQHRTDMGTDGWRKEEAVKMENSFEKVQRECPENVVSYYTGGPVLTRDSGAN